LWNYVNDTAGIPGNVTRSSPRWLRLVLTRGTTPGTPGARAGDTITGYDSANGVHWSKVGTVQLAGLPGTVQAGLFTTSPLYSTVTSQSIGGGSGTQGPALASASFDNVKLRGGWGHSAWRGTDVGGSDPNYPAVGGGFRQTGPRSRPAADRFVVTGSGDIAPAVPGQTAAPR
jgi:hypothetical protein